MVVFSVFFYCRVFSKGNNSKSGPLKIPVGLDDDPFLLGQIAYVGS